MKIRKYKPVDRQEVLNMVSEVLGDIFNGDPHQFKLLKEFRVKKDYLSFLVVEVDKRVVGTMALKKIDNKTVRLKRMYVRKGYEGRGIAQKLLDNLVNFAREKGYEKMILSTYPIMENAHRFYKKNGFVETAGEDPERVHVMKYLK
ncbi:MAG: GNAT family N-acetyltransferase [Candidatus Pacearchaeota archaeon]